jgi:hypothetical protein
MMEPIDYAVVDKAKMREGFGWEYAASSYFYSYIIAYDAKKYGDNPPTSMADFFDVEKFPGKRGMYKWGAGMWEALLMGDGVAPADLYPLDVEAGAQEAGILQGTMSQVLGRRGGKPVDADEWRCLDGAGLVDPRQASGAGLGRRHRASPGIRA